MKVEKIQYNPLFRQEKPQSVPKPLLGSLAAAAVVTPFIPVIDGDSFKSVFNNRNFIKYIGGMAAIGAGTVLLNNVLVKNTAPDKQKISNTTKNILFGTLLAPAFLAVEHWSMKTKNPLNKWMVPASLFVGAVVGSITGVFSKEKT